MRALLPLVGTMCLAALATVGVMLALEMPRIPPVAPPPARASTPDTSTAPTPVSLPRLRPAVYYQAITDRPVFAPERRPFVPQAAPEPDPVPQPAPDEPPAPEPNLPPDLAIMGAMNNADTPIALISQDGAPAEWASVGTDFDGWTLTDIGPDWIVITDGLTDIRLDMFQ